MKKAEEVPLFWENSLHFEIQMQWHPGRCYILPIILMIFIVLFYITDTNLDQESSSGNRGEASTIPLLSYKCPASNTNGSFLAAKISFGLP